LSASPRTSPAAGAPHRPVRLFATGLAVGVAGLAVFARLLDWLLAAHREFTVAALVGVMAGSLRRLWPLDAHTTIGDAVILAAVAGAGFAALTLFDHWRTGANPLARALGLRVAVRG